VKYVYIDDLPTACCQKPGQVLFAVRDAVEMKHEPEPMDVNVWRSQMLGGLRFSDWDSLKSIKPVTTNN
jgi:hypothetical protein